MAYKLILPPDQASYSVVDGKETIRQQLDGGLGRYRRDIIGASRIVNCQWSVGQEEYQYLRSFYKIISGLSEPFRIDLYLDSPLLTEHDAHFIPDSMRLSSQSGQTFIVTCQLEAEPLDTEEFDLSYIDLIGYYGNAYEVSQVVNLLAKLVNVDLPRINLDSLPPEAFATFVNEDGEALADEDDNVLVGV